MLLIEMYVWECVCASVCKMLIYRASGLLFLIGVVDNSQPHNFSKTQIPLDKAQ